MRMAGRMVTAKRVAGNCNLLNAIMRLVTDNLLIGIFPLVHLLLIFLILKL